MADTINRRCGCKGSPEGVWVVNCGASAVTPGNCVSTSDCKGTCDNTGKFKPNKGTDLEHNKEITMDPKVPTPRGPGEIKPKDTASGTLMESKMKKLIKRTLLMEGPYCNGAGQDPSTHTPCHRRGLGCLNMDEGYFGEMGQCVTCNPEWACVRIGGGNDLPLDSDGPLTRTDLQNRGSGGRAKDSIRLRESELVNLIKGVINERDLKKYYCYKCKGGFFRGTCHHHGSQLAPRGARPSDCQSLAECEDSCTRGGGRMVDTSDKRTSIELRESELVNLIKRVINEREEKPNFDSIIKQGREKGKLRGISDDEATMELNRAWSILQDNPITPDTGKKFSCKGCGGGRGLCILGGCFNGKGITWRF